jgi:hypothetical protein
MRITRDLLLKLAKDTVKQRTANDRNIVAAFLIGAVREMDDPLLGGTADIDLLFISDDRRHFRDCVKLNNEVTLDILYEPLANYEPARKLRADALRGHLMYDPMPLYETRHFFEFVQSAVRSQFDDPANVLARTRPFAEHARQLWMELQLTADDPSAAELKKYLEALRHAANAIAGLTGAPLTDRRFISTFALRAASANTPDLVDALSNLLGAPNLNPAEARTWLADWEQALGVAIDRKVDERLHPLRIPYYRKAIEAQLDSDKPSSALWPLLDTWTTAAAAMSELRQPARAWQTALESLGLLGGGFEAHLQALDRFIDRVEERLEQISA